MSATLCWPRPPYTASAREPNVPRALQRRLAWSKRTARELWEPRLEALRGAAQTIELHQVQTGALPATVFWTPFHDLEAMLAKTASLGLACVPMGGILERHFDEQAVDVSDPATALTYPILVGAPDTLKTTLHLLTGNDQREIAGWFRYPDCCAQAWCVRQAAGWTDPTAAMLSSSRESVSGGPGAAQMVLAGLGLGPVRHAACSVHCHFARANALEFIAAGRELGLEHQMSWLDELAEWEIDYSMVAGIAEIRTALFRCTHFSDPGRTPIRFRHQEETSGDLKRGRGISAPSAAPGTVAQDGRGTRVAAAGSINDEFGTGWAIAGFDSPFSMRSRYCSVIWEQTRLLRGKLSSVLNLSCNDGLLLKLATEVNPRIIPFGSDTDEGLVGAARRRHPAFVANFLTADWLTSLCKWRQLLGKPADVLFLDPEMLIDMPSRSAAEIRQEMTGLAKSIIAVASDRALGRFGNISALAAAAGLTIVGDAADRVSVVVNVGNPLVTCPLPTAPGTDVASAGPA